MKRHKIKHSEECNRGEKMFTTEEFLKTHLMKHNKDDTHMHLLWKVFCKWKEGGETFNETQRGMAD